MTNADAIREVPPHERDPEVLEAWERPTAQPAIGGVYATKVSASGWSWQVSFGILEFVREEPLLGELIASIENELSAVEGVAQVTGEDREVFAVRGTPAGDNLVQAGVRAVDGLGVQLRAYYNGVVAGRFRRRRPPDENQRRLMREARDRAGPTFLDALATLGVRELNADELRAMEQRYPGARPRGPRGLEGGQGTPGP